MTIERVTRFETHGQLFLTLQKAIDYREGLIEKFFRSLPGFDDIRAKDRIPFLEAIMSRRKELTELLNYDLLPIDDDDE